MEQAPNLETLFQFFKPYIRKILFFSLLMGLLGTTIVFLRSPKYKSTTTVLAGNSLFQDKARLFNPNIKDLYSYFGNTDDLDRISAIAASDTILHNVFVQNNLWKFYNGTDSFPDLRSFKKDLDFHKTDKDQLLISTTLSDAGIAAAVSNSIAEATNKHLQSLVFTEQKKTIQTLHNKLRTLKQQYDSANTMGIEKEQLFQRINDQEKILHEWKQQQAIAPNFIAVAEFANPNRAITVPDKSLFIFAFTLCGFVAACFFVAIIKSLR